MMREIPIVLMLDQRIYSIYPGRKMSLSAIGEFIGRLACWLTGWYRCAGWQADYAGSAFSLIPPPASSTFTPDSPVFVALVSLEPHLEILP